MTREPSALPTFLRRHPALLVTTAYLAVSLIGMAFSWGFFRRFGVNYFVFADLTDFLLGAAREPMSLAAAVGGVVVVWLIFRYADWEYRRLERKPDKGWLMRAYLRQSAFALRSGWMIGLAVALYVFAAVNLYGGWRADALRSGEGTAATIRFAGDQTASGPLMLMGSSARFLFLYDPANDETVVVANENVRELRIAAPEVEAAGEDPDS